MKIFYIRIDGYTDIWQLSANSISEANKIVKAVVRNKMKDVYGDTPRYHISTAV